MQATNNSSSGTDTVDGLCHQLNGMELNNPNPQSDIGKTFLEAFNFQQMNAYLSSFLRYSDDDYDSDDEYD